jgi:hypothetical protein
MTTKKRVLLILVLINFSILLLSCVVSAQESMKGWKVWRQKGHCSISRQDWLAISEDPPGSGWMLCNGSSTQFTFAASAAEMDFLKMSQCQGELPNCPKFKNDCCKFSLYLNPQTGAFSVAQQGNNPPGGTLLVRSDMCCEDAAMEAGLALGCTQLDLTSVPGTRVVITENGWRSLTGPVTIASNPPLVIATLGATTNKPGIIVQNDDEPGWIFDDGDDNWIDPGEVEDGSTTTGGDDGDDPWIGTGETEDGSTTTGGDDGIIKPPGAGRWVLESVTPSPVTPPQGWSYSSGSASLQIYNGDRATFSWTPPPQQFDSNGFTVSLSAQGNPATPTGRFTALISVDGSGLQSDTPSEEWSAYAKADSGSSSATKSVTFKPVASSSTIEVTITIQWAIKFTYAYRKAD